MNKKRPNLVIGVDLDGVCADFYRRMREIAAEWFEKDIKELPENPSYGLEEWGVTGPDSYQSLHRFAVTQRDLFKTMVMIPGTRKYLRKLSDEGCRIRIITHRLFIHHFHASAVQQTIEWLDRNGIPYWDLCFMKDKDEVGADVYVEDAPQNVAALRAGGHYTICFANSTNLDAGEPRVKSWAEAYKLITRKKQELLATGSR
jgi:5'(3')-deoxyribonucleotidase